MTAFTPDLFVGTRTESLDGLKITLCGGGGIAAIELPKIAREFRRHGASVRFFVTENCLRFIGKESLEWASTNEVIVNPSGFAEHICHDDAVVVIPTTADLMGKIAHGICTDGVTTLIQSALGHGIPVLFCPTMHESLAASPLVKENREKLENVSGIHFLSPRIEEGKEKAPTPENLVLEASHFINAHKYFKGRSPRILVTYGGTRASLDEVRCLTNLSTGSLGKALVKLAFRSGLSVTALEGNVVNPLSAVGKMNIMSVPEYSDMLAYLKGVDPAAFDGIFHIAAVSDFLPAEKRAGKIESSQDEFAIRLVRSEKFIALPNLKGIPFQVGCKLTSGSPKVGLETARTFLTKNSLNAVLWNPSSVLQQEKADNLDNTPSMITESEEILRSEVTQGNHKGIILANTEEELTEIPVADKESISKVLLELFLKNCSGKGV